MQARRAAYQPAASIVSSGHKTYVCPVVLANQSSVHTSGDELSGGFSAYPCPAGSGSRLTDGEFALADATAATFAAISPPATAVRRSRP